MDFLGFGSDSKDKKEEKEEEKNTISGIDTKGPFAVATMSDDGVTTQPDESTIADNSSQPKENCLVLDKTKEPLKSDVGLIESGNFKDLIQKSLGKSSVDSEGRSGWAKDAANTAYYDKLGFYNLCTPNREKEQTFISEKGEEKIDAGKLKYGMDLLDTETKELPGLLNKYFSEYDSNDTIVPLLTELGNYLSNDIDYNVKYDEIMALEDNGVKVFDTTQLNNQDDEATKVHKMLFCFAWQYSGAEDELKGGMIPTNAIVEGNLTQPSGKYRKYIISAMCIMGFIYFTFVLFEAFRLFIGTTNRILDARAVYLHTTGEDEIPNNLADHNYLNYFYSFFTVMYQSGAGTLIQVLESYQELAILKAKNILNVVATETGRTAYDRCQQGWFSCINGYFTGATQDEALATARIVTDTEVHTAYIKSIEEIKLSFNSIVADANFATTGFVTGINGLITCSVIMGNQINPEIYTITHVTASVASLQSSYLTSPVWALGAISSNFGILFAPNALKDVPKQGSSSDVPPPPSGQLSVSDMSPNSDIQSETSLLTDRYNQTERDAADGLLGLEKGGKKNPRFLSLLMGGKRKTGKRKSVRKTVKRKKRKQKGKTKRRKTIKRKNKRKTKRRN